MSQLPLINQPTWHPTNKVLAVGAGGTGATALLTLVAGWVGLDVTPEDADTVVVAVVAITGAVTTLATLIGGYFKRDRAAEPAPVKAEGVS